ncbi:hypothetical protein [Streptomyces bohaiensis]|uniref:Uncharacterized protein n=1 Tax=Streptomyces bohaiensis TaxID=1431344 RepID=A0ABX1C5V2_9ACTN|nr:hypothetical protein [Streptomyces bohaiensis]NJQ14566.1 hypothetical protein [Streptomyces bohaiensis]
MTTGRTSRGLRARFTGDSGGSAALRMAAFAAALAAAFGTAFTVGTLTEPAAPPPVETPGSHGEDGDPRDPHDGAGHEDGPHGPGDGSGDGHDHG